MNDRCPLCDPPESCAGYPHLWRRLREDPGRWAPVHAAVNGLASFLTGNPRAVAAVLARLKAIHGCRYFDRPPGCGCAFGRCLDSGKPTSYAECDRCLEGGEGRP